MEDKSHKDLPTSDQWRVLIGIAELGTITAAAEALDIDPIQAGKMVSRLEKQVGEPLLVRSSKKVSLTWVGQQCCSRMKPILEKCDSLLHGRERGKTQNSKFRVAVPYGLHRLFLKWIANFSEEESVLIEPVPYFPHLPPHVEAFDLFIAQATLPNERIYASELGMLRRIIVATPEFCRSQLPVREPEDLKGRSLLGIHAFEQLTKEGVSFGLEINTKASVQDSQSALDFVRYGNCYGVGIPLWTAEEDLEKGTMVRILPEWECSGEKVWILRPSKNYSSESLKRLADFLQDNWRKKETGAKIK